MLEPTVLTGVGAATGMAVGQAVVVRLRAHDVRYRIGPGDVDAEQVRLAQACDQTRAQLESIRVRAREMLGTDMAAMFDAQLLMLDDPLLRKRAQALVASRHLNADWAVLEAGAELTQRLRAVEDTYLRERHGDLTDVLERIRANLQGQGPDATWLAEQLARFAEPCVLVADDLPVSVAVQLEWRHVAACVTEAGTRTAHLAILARSVGLPAVVGVANATHTVPPGAVVLVDGESGTVTVGPDQARIAAIDQRHTGPLHKAPRVTGPVLTADGAKVDLYANVERPEDVPFALREGAAGLGLVRSELLMGGVALGDASEDLQFDVYSTLLEAAGPGTEVTIRTFDMTPDDAGLPVPPDTDPRERLGMRALRFSLAHPSLFDRQARALVRASTRGRLRIMFPFVTQVAELDQARARVAAVAASLGQPVPPLGAMVEVPAAALDAVRIAERSAFLSVGTNDLIQYTLAADRNDARVSHLYDPLHPAVLRLLRAVARAARRVGRRASVCGEMASEPALLAVLLGLGFREFSMAASSLRAARDTIGAISLEDARTAARQALAGRDVSSVVVVR